MHKLNTYDQYTNLVASIYNMKTTMYMLPEEIKGYIRDEKLYYDNHRDTSLLLFIEHEQFFKLFVYTNTDEQLAVARQQKPVVADIVYYERKGEGGIAEVLKKSGFENLALYRQYSVRHEELILQENGLGEYRVEFATYEQIPVLLSILSETFSPVSNDLPDEALLEKRVKENSVLCLISPSGEVCGCTQWMRNKETCQIKHVALIPQVRGMGLGKKLCTETFRKANGKNYNTWVEENNTVKQQIDAAFGYKFNGKCMLKLILE